MSIFAQVKLKVLKTGCPRRYYKVLYLFFICKALQSLICEVFFFTKEVLFLICKEISALSNKVPD